MDQSPRRPAGRESGWEALCRTADEVRALPTAAPLPPRHGCRGLRVAAGAALAASLFALGHLHAQPAAADSSADADLFSLTNQDRASNGVPALASDGTLGAIGEAAPYSGCSGAGTVHGRAQDMINRDYFSHQIPPCGQYVWPMMSAYGVAYRSAGENIGWVNGEGSGDAAAHWINQAFMNSSDHRANILNPNYTDLGIGSAEAPGGVSWTYPGAPGSYQNVWMFAQEFAQLHSSSAPPPTRAPAPPARTSPVAQPATPTPAPAATALPTPSPTAEPTPTPSPSLSPSPVPAAPATLLPAYYYRGQGLISDTIESTLEAFLFD